MSKSVVKADHHFAMVPEWVLYADISSNAVRVYATLRRFADQGGLCYPSRRLLAVKCHCSPATIDRALDELQAVGAVIVQGRVNKSGDRTSNLYTVLSVPNGSPVDQGGSPVDNPLCTGDETPLLTGDEGTIAIINESQPNHMATAKAIAQGWWEAQEQKPLQSFIALVKVIERAVKAGYETERIEGALSAMKMVPTVAQLEAALKGIRFGKQDTGQTASQVAARKRLDETLAKLNRERGTE